MTYARLRVREVIDNQMKQRKGRTVISLCADHGINDKIRYLVQSMIHDRISLEKLDFRPERSLTARIEIPCIDVVFQAELCTPTDQTCICTNEQFQQTWTGCVASNCTIPETLTTQNASVAYCDAPTRDRTGNYIASSITLASIAGVFVVIRFAYKIFIGSLGFGLDDWLVLVAMITVVPSTVIIYATTTNGLGKDIWTLTADQITNALRYLWITGMFYFAQCTLVKLTIIAFFLRIFPSRGVQRLLWATFILTTLWGFICILLLIFQCKPTSYFWTGWDGLHEGSCFNASAGSWANASISIALDIWILAIPLWQLRTLNLHWKKKAGVAVMFCVGALVTIVSILRLRALVHFGESQNPTWDFYDIAIWSTIEICVGIMCACLPTIRMLLVRLWPALGSSVRSNGNHYQQYGGKSQSKAGRIRGRDIELVVPNRPKSEQDNDTPGGYFQKTPTVQYSDNDEASLIVYRITPFREYHAIKTDPRIRSDLASAFQPAGPPLHEQEPVDDKHDLQREFPGLAKRPRLDRGGAALPALVDVAEVADPNEALYKTTSASERGESAGRRSRKPWRKASIVSSDHRQQPTEPSWLPPNLRDTIQRRRTLEDLQNAWDLCLRRDPPMIVCVGKTPTLAYSASLRP
ncbi:hypothetical protein NM208_g6480 [Fusarium decemcellulare]|uniref:Uncharacterized protein n=1 Tax=Fusarium decemcellulare TaxID=57161 RepID=A0ACC1SCU4_9HYPO|nr:hypothetical protein NM208_g6480 [Fusarium decemcellulare]